MSADSDRQLQRDPNLSSAGDPRVAASVVLAGIVAVLIGAVFMAIGPELKSNGPAVAAVSGGQRATPVRTIGAPAREDTECGRQVWPNIDQRCLVPVKREAAADNRLTDNKLAATPDDAKLSPLTATAPVGKNLPAPPDAAVAAAVPDNSAARDAEVLPARSDATVGFASDEPEEAPVRRPVRRHSGFPFPFGFRF